MSHHRAVVPFRVDFRVTFCSVLPVKLAYLSDSNAAAHSVESHIFQGSDSSISALQDLTLAFIFLKHCQIVGNLSLYASTSSVMTHRRSVVTRDRDKKSHYNLNYDSHHPLFHQIARIERCVEYAFIATCEYALIYTFRS